MSPTPSRPTDAASLREHFLPILCALIVGDLSHPGLENLSSDDWSRLAELAQRERVQPILYWALEQNKEAFLVPPSILESLRSILRMNQIRNISIQYDLADHILPALEGKVNPVVVLKGGALAFTLYLNPGLRPLGDIDILVPPEQLDRVEQCLGEIGFHRDMQEVAEGFDNLIRHHIHLGRRTPRPLHVEVHQRLFGTPSDWFTAPLEWFWTQTETYLIPNAHGGVTTAWTFSPTANLIYLSGHLMLSHGEARSQLLWFYDLHLILQKWSERIDWDLLVERAGELEWAPVVSAALEGVQKRFGSRIPEGVLEQLDGLKQERAAELVKMRSQEIFLDRAVGRLLVLQTKDWPGRAKMLWAFLFPSPEYIHQHHNPRPSWLWPLYYPYRWGYMLRDVGLAIWRLMRRT